MQKTLFALPFVFAVFVWNTGQSIHVDALGYYTGYIIGMLVDIIISVVFTGGAKTVADVMRLLQEQLKTVFKLIQKAVAKTGEAILRSIDEIIAIFAKIRNGAKNIKPFLDEILELLRKLLKSNKADDFFDFIKKLQKGAGDINKTFAENAGIKIEKWLTEVKVIGQTTDHTCAATSLRMILEDKGIIKLEDELARALKTDVDGASILDIPEALYFKRLEDQVEAVAEGKIKLQSLIEKLNEGDKAIVSVFKKDFGSHAMVLEKIENGKVFLRDPLPKNHGASYIMEVKEFKKIFNEKAVIIKK
ncbi:putative double-glycine peptidase [Flavobacterium arsenatis]|uniref:Double-glycine peptidase n=1 Tax=Flavobacterium arsenatis TaxID=1484332 RepID=A0ABU1TRJ2_9FLAO|nr:cysteine peptidase family C39 domain-containing protein [Flavobacterium arsenatis]MDR6968498.1 putative double-glycine peptidase [Flavobacterium arsenatis]